MRITERLKAEHGVFLWQLDHLQALVRSAAPREILQAVVETIASAERRHAGIEERLLYPALVKVVGREFPLLQQSRAEHDELQRLSALIGSGTFDEVTVDEFADVLRAHIEREIHNVFVLAEDMIAAETLEAMSNWDVEHIHEIYAKHRPWAEKRLG
jgi:hemerythrin-like domain-containing protein